MFEYVRNEYNPQPRLVISGEPVPERRFVHDIRYAAAPFFPLPESAAALRALHSSKYWRDLRRRERLLRDNLAGVEFRIVTDEAELRAQLPRVQQLFAARWADEYTSCSWKSPVGFAPYAEAMTDLARQQRAELAVLEGDGRLLSFAYALREGRTYHLYQHATTPESVYRRFAVGKILVAKIVEDLVENRRAAVFDFMTGDLDYKREWTAETRGVHVRIAEKRTPYGAARFGARVVYWRFRLAVQNGNPTVRAAAKRILGVRDRLRRARPSGPGIGKFGDACRSTTVA